MGEEPVPQATTSTINLPCLPRSNHKSSTRTLSSQLARPAMIRSRARKPPSRSAFHQRKRQSCSLGCTTASFNARPPFTPDEEHRTRLSVVLRNLLAATASAAHRLQSTAAAESPIAVAICIPESRRTLCANLVPANAKPAVQLPAFRAIANT